MKYEEYFGFLEPPFEADPNPAVFYPSPVYQEAFTGLRYGVKLRQGLIVLTGPPGTGKTTLLQIAATKFDSSIVAAVVLRRNPDFTELLRLISLEDGLANRSADRALLVQKLRNYLSEQLRRDRIVAMLLDQAEDLDDRTIMELKFLSDLEIDGNKLIQIVLAGRPELEAKLNRPWLKSFKQRVARWYRLDSLKIYEIAPYIEYRLSRAGYQGDPLFTAEAIAEIASISKGIPRLINMICDGALVTTCGTGEKRVSAEMIEHVAGDLRLTSAAPKAAPFFSAVYKRRESEQVSAESTAEFSERYGTGLYRGETSKTKTLGTARTEFTPQDARKNQDRATDVNGPAAAGGDTETEDRWEWPEEESLERRETQTKRRGFFATLRHSRTGDFVTVLVVLGSAAAAYVLGNNFVQSKNANVIARAQHVGDRQVEQRAEVVENTSRQLATAEFGVASQRAQPLTQTQDVSVESIQPAPGNGAVAPPGRRFEQGKSRRTPIVESITDKTKPVVQRTSGLDPKVYMHTSAVRDRAVLESIGDALRVKGYAIPDMRLTSNRTQGDVRFFFPEDRREAERVKSVVESELRRRGYHVSLKLLERDGRKFEFAAPGKIEVWLPPLGRPDFVSSTGY